MRRKGKEGGLGTRDMSGEGRICLLVACLRDRQMQREKETETERESVCWLLNVPATC